MSTDISNTFTCTASPNYSENSTQSLMPPTTTVGRHEASSISQRFNISNDFHALNGIFYAESHSRTT